MPLSWSALTSSQWSSLLSTDWTVLLADSLSANIVNRIIVLYRSGDADSLTFAQYYQALHGLDDSQLVEITCSNTEILANYATFQAEIESQVASYVADPYNSYQMILVGLNIPGGFYDGGDVIATTSRLARINFSYVKKEANPVFNRRIYSPFNDNDALSVLICSRIDAPDLETAIKLLDNSKRVIQQKIINGTFFFDPYTAILNGAESSYFDELIDFRDHTLPLLNLPTFETVFWDEYTDVVIPRLNNDSFMWSWKANRAGYSFFEDTKTPRVFLYNADSDDTGTIRDADDKRLPMLSINSGYVATAGAMSDPGAGGHLRPTPFFESLFHGGSIGEAFLFACPFFNWTVGLIGDPLIAVNFPVGTDIDNTVSPLATWSEIHDHLASTLAYMLLREGNLTTCANTVIDTGDINIAQLGSLFTTAFISYQNQWKSPMRALINSFVLYSTNNDSRQFAFDNFLASNNLLISRLVQLIEGSYIAAATNTLPQGYWKVEVPIVNNPDRYSTYSFQLDIATTSDFTTILQSHDSSISQTGWTYEKDANAFQSVPSTGVSSSFAGRRVKFEPTVGNYMSSLTVYFYRIRQKDDLGAFTTYESAQAIIYT